MTSIKKLASALFLALCFSAYSNAQTVDQTTGNLVNPNGWFGVNYGNLPGDCCTGGPAPLVTPNGTINFSYGHYNVANLIDFTQVQALSGPGIRVTGYNYAWTINANTSNGIDSVNANIGLYSPAGSLIQNYNYHAMGTGTYAGTQNFTRPYSLAEARYLQLNFDSFDNGYWAGYYGPTVSNISLVARFTVDPCVANPLYSVDCPGFNNVVLSGNLLPNPSTSADWGGSIDQIVAISTALEHSGSGVKVHGFNWGYDVVSAPPYCASWFVACLDNRDPLVRTTVDITNSSGETIYTSTKDYNDISYWQSKSYSYVLPQSMNSLSLGTFRLRGQTWDNAGIDNPWMNIDYTPDQCLLDPLHSTSCSGYAQAFYNQQCTLNPLYDSGCPGYAQANYSYQCSANTLYDSGCPGYAQAYFTQQCSLDPLYNQSCPGYAQAYFNQQCSINPLYNQQCVGYAEAYFAQQCNLNQLYSTQCAGYAQAKALKDLKEQQVEQTASTTSSTTTSTPQQSQSSATVALADPTKSETEVTTDVGGVELSTSGTISIPTGETTATKEAIKESAAVSVAVSAEKPKEVVEEKKVEEKKKVDPKALAVAMSAVAATERTALQTSEAAVAYSISETATSSVPSLGTGLTLQLSNQGTSVQSATSFSSSSSSDQSRGDVQALQQQRQASSVNNVELLSSSPSVIIPQDAQLGSKQSVRGGGKVEGMEGGPDPAQLAKVPADFNQYLNMQIRDSQFYAQKEIYKGQRVVDNERSLRLLNSRNDRVHQEMVNQQYGR